MACSSVLLMETFAEDAGVVRDFLAPGTVGSWRVAVSHPVPGQEEAGLKFSDYFAASELLKRIQGAVDTV